MSTPQTRSQKASQIGLYKLVKKIGSGGMGVVYEAMQLPIERRVAIKLLHPEYAYQQSALERFFNEARAVNLIEHPSIVQISDYGRCEDGAAYLVMEFLRGETLESRIRRCTEDKLQFSVGAAIQISVQIASALVAAHEKGIVHRDIKPANVMLVFDPVALGGERVKLLDFGIAKLVQERSGHTAPDAVMGTPRYMSPEQCRGAKDVDEKTDVYALGVILYELLAGEPPFVADNIIAYAAHHNLSEPAPLHVRVPHVPIEVSCLVSRLLEKNKHARPPMEDVVVALSSLLVSPMSGGATEALASTAGRGCASIPDASVIEIRAAGSLHLEAQPRVQRRFGRTRTLGGLAGLAAGALVVGVLFTKTARRQSRQQPQPAQNLPAVTREQAVQQPPAQVTVEEATPTASQPSLPERRSAALDPAYKPSASRPAAKLGASRPFFDSVNRVPKALRRQTSDPPATANPSGPAANPTDYPLVQRED